MAMDYQLYDAMQKRLESEFNSLSEGIISGMCKDFADYKERCGYIRAVRNTNDWMREEIQRLNNPQPQGTDNDINNSQFS